jgi:precorrin-6B methylase 2
MGLDKLFPALLSAAILVLPACTPPVTPTVKESPNGPRNEPRITSGQASPDGIGRFYMGREIAKVMGHQAAGWLERSERQQEERPDLLLDALGLAPGDVVADIGAGSGYFSLPMARRVGPQGRVLAVDIQPEMLTLLAANAEAEELSNIVGVLGAVDDPRLPPGEVDLALIVDAYHEFSHPYAMVEGIVEGLAPGGRLVLVEYRGEDRDLAIKRLHKMTEAQVRREMEPFPLRWVETLEILPTQHILVFEKI